MILGDWVLIDTLGDGQTWSVLTVGTEPRQWKSLSRTILPRVLPTITSAFDTGTRTEVTLPKSRQAWSEQRALAIPVVGPQDRVHGVLLWVGAPEPPPPTPVGTFLLDSRTRRTEVRSPGLGPAFDRGRSVWTGAESFEYVERFDGALDMAATVSRAEPGSRWLGTETVRTPAGLRTLLVAVRNTIADPHTWRGLLVDVTDSIPAQGKSFEAATVDTLVGGNPGLHLAVVDTEQLRLIRWVSDPVPGLQWSGDTDERTMPHPDDLGRILAARKEIRAGAGNCALPGLRLAAIGGGWLVVDVEASPLPYGTSDAGPPQFALVRLDLRTREP